MPLLAAIAHQKRPVEKIAHVRQNFPGSARIGRRAISREFRWRAAHCLAAAIRQSGHGVAQHFQGSVQSAVHEVHFRNFRPENFGHASQPVDWVEDFEQLLLFFQGQRQIGADSVGQFAGFVHLHGMQGPVPVQAELGISYETPGHAAHQGVHLRARLNTIVRRAHGRAEKPILIG